MGTVERFPVYSLAKTFSAAAILALDIPLDGPIGGLADVPEEFAGVGVGDVLRHRSGLPEYGAWPEYHAALADPHPWSYADLMDRAAAAGLGPRDTFRYSNVGYAIIRRILERQTGSTYFEALAALVFGPLGVTDARPFAEPTDLIDLTPSAVDISGYHPGWVLTGTFTSTVAELERAYSALLGGALGDPQRMLGGFPVDAPGHPLADPGYAVGLMTSGFPALLAGHGGGGPGYTIFALATVDGSRAHVEFVPGEVDDAPLIRRCLAAIGR